IIAINSVPRTTPYHGSKRHLVPAILSDFPDNINRLIEPFAGSAALSLAAAHNGKAKRFWLNDINAPLVELWREIIERPQPLATRYQTLWQMQQHRERRFYDAVRARFNRTQRPYYLLYLLARCV